jgi:hypothetical protein
MEEALRASESRYRDLYKANDIIYLTDEKDCGLLTQLPE